MSRRVARFVCEVSRSPTLINVFAGAGGLALGFEQAGFTVAGAIEPDPVHAATFKRNFSRANIVCGPVQATSLGDIAAVPDVDVVAGSLPSSAFSNGGRRDPEDDRRRFLDDFTELVTAIGPTAYALEAVPGVLSRANADRFRSALARMTAAGYASPQVWNLNAADFDVPQNRARVWVIGVKDGVTQPTTPTATVLPVHRRPSGLPVVPRPGVRVGPTVWDAIGDLPNPSDHIELRTSDRMRRADIALKPSGWASRLATSEKIGCSAVRCVDPLMLTASQATDHTFSSLARFEQTPPGDVEPVSRFYRLHPEGLSRTLRAGTGRDRGSFTGPRPLHPTQPRVITVREGARLQGFPDWFGFNATKWHGFHQVGASAPPPVASAVAERLLAALELSPHTHRHDEHPDDRLLFLDLTRAARCLGATVLPEPRRRGTRRRPRPQARPRGSAQLSLPVDNGVRFS
jgi:DNA (cytosine-5)-methyltransferase 1